MIKIKEKEVLKTIYDNTHLKSEDNKDVPYFCFVSDVVDYLELDLSEEEVAQIALDADAGYTIFKVFAEETIPGGLLICADGCEKEEIENMYKDFYACEPPSIDPWLEEPLKEAKKKKPKKVGDPNAKAMWGRTRNKVEPPKKGKSSYKRKSKHKKVVEEIDFITAYFNNVNSASSPSINEDMDDDFYIEDDINVEIASVNPKEEMLKGVYELKQKYTDEAAGLGAEISFFEDISPKRIYSFWYDDDIAVIEYNDYVIIIYSYGDVCFFDNTRDNNREIYGKKELFNAGYYTDDQVMEALDDDVLEVDCTNHISFALKKEGEDDFKYSYDMGYESMDDIYDALDIKWYIEAVIPDYTSRFIEKEQLDTQIIKESNGKPSKNDLKKAARRHKKTDKKGARGWFVNPDAGNVEKNIAFFNHATGGSSSGVGEASPGLGEDLDNEHTEEQFLLDGTKYDNQAIKILDDANLFSHETNEKIIQLLYKGDEENEPDIHAFVHSPNWLMKYLKGIARMLVEYAEGSSTKAQEFLGEAPSVFEPVLTWVKTNRTDKNAKELDDNFVNKFSFQDVKDFLDEIHSQEQEISDKKLADLDTSKKSNYSLIPINSYEEMEEFGDNVTGDSSISVSSPWCYATGTLVEKNKFDESLSDYEEDIDGSINEAVKTNSFTPYTAGYILEDGSLLVMDEYHGETEIREFYPEYSNTHPEEDTCVRLYSRPNEAQYKRLEEIIDYYLNHEFYCKVEVWDKPLGKSSFYEVYSLYEGACRDTTWNEKIGNWTGYKLVQIIKNYFAKRVVESDYNNKINKDSDEDIDENDYIVESMSNKEKEVIDTLDKYFGQKEPYVWSTYILPNGHFLNPENYKKDDAEWQNSLSYEHEDFYFVLDELGSVVDGVFENYCIKVNVTFPYVAMPNNRATPEQFSALRKLIDRRGEFEYSFGEISDIVENGSDVYDMNAPLIIILKNSEIVVDLDSTDVNSIVKMISRAYTTGALLTESASNESEQSDKRDEIEDRVMKDLGTSSEPIDGPSYIMRDGSFLKIWEANVDINGMSGGKSVSGKAQHLDVDGYISKHEKQFRVNYYLNHNCIRVNTGFEEYMVMPKVRPNSKQFDSLLKWLDYYFINHSKIQVLDWYGSHVNSKVYYAEENFPEDIIKKIKRYYATGTLVESLNTRQIQELEQYLKDNYEENSLTQRGVILSDGTIIEVSRDIEGNLRSHEQFMREVLSNSKIDLNINTSYYDDIWSKIGIIRVNGEYENSILLAEARPTLQQYRALEKWLKNLILEKPDVFLWLSEERASVGIVFNYAQTSKVLVTSEVEVIEMIRNFYRTGKFLTEKLDSDNSLSSIENTYESINHTDYTKNKGLLLKAGLPQFNESLEDEDPYAYTFDYKTKSVDGKDVIDTTTLGGFEFYLKALRTGEDKENNLVGEIFEMSPNEYYEVVAQEIFNNRVSVEDLKSMRGYNKEKIEGLKTVITKQKKRFPIPFLDFRFNNRGQEGLHRMYVLGELFGWDTDFPVAIFNYLYEQEERDNVEWKRQSLIKRDINDALDRLVSSSNNIEDEFDFNYYLQYYLNQSFGTLSDDEDVEYEVEFKDNKFVIIVNNTSVEGDLSKFKYFRTSLTEGKADWDNFRNAVGDDLYDRFIKQKNRIKNKDIGYWSKRPKELERELNNLEKIPTQSQKREKAKEGADLVYDDGRWLVYKISTADAAAYYGKDTKWCITSTEPFDIELLADFENLVDEEYETLIEYRDNGGEFLAEHSDDDIFYLAQDNVVELNSNYKTFGEYYFKGHLDKSYDENFYFIFDTIKREKWAFYADSISYYETPIFNEEDKEVTHIQELPEEVYNIIPYFSNYIPH